MMPRTHKTIAVILAGLFSHLAISNDEIVVSPVQGVAEVRDLLNVASELGLHFEMFDYETIDDHCLHFYIDEFTNDEPVTRHDGSGHCGVAGKHRLTVSWKLDQGAAKFSFKRFNRELGQGGGVGGLEISVPNSMGSTLYRISPPSFSIGSKTTLLHGAYGWKSDNITDFKVIVEFRPNPEGIVGTE